MPVADSQRCEILHLLHLPVTEKVGHFVPSEKRCLCLYG